MPSKETWAVDFQCRCRDGIWIWIATLAVISWVVLVGVGHMYESMVLHLLAIYLLIPLILLIAFVYTYIRNPRTWPVFVAGGLLVSVMLITGILVACGWRPTAFRHLESPVTE